MLYLVYRLATWIALPFLPLLLWWRAGKGKEERARMRERFGYASAPNSENIIWVHAASVGEMNTALPLIVALGERLPNANFLLTTVTVTSAALVENKLPQRTIHQFAPLDSPPIIKRFLNHWQPDAALIMESELWPNMIVETARSGASLLIVNGRISDKSHRMWARFSGSARFLFSAFQRVYAGSTRDAEKYRLLGAHADYTGNLKYDAPPLPYDAAEFAALQQQVGARPVWVAASTHPGEEQLLAQTHHELKKTIPDLLTIIVPRHAARGERVASMLLHYDGVASRSKQEPINDTTGFYVADTMGELGLFYRLCNIVFIGGSLVAHGGQNLIEPAQLGCALLCGPHMQNFAEVVEEFKAVGAVTQVADIEALTAALSVLFASTEKREAAAEASRKAAARYQGLTAKLADSLAIQLDPKP